MDCIRCERLVFLPDFISSKDGVGKRVDTCSILPAGFWQPGKPFAFRILLLFFYFTCFALSAVHFLLYLWQCCEHMECLERLTTL